MAPLGGVILLGGLVALLAVAAGVVWLLDRR